MKIADLLKLGTMIKWRYTFYNYDPATEDNYERRMNYYGEEGWELVSAYLTKKPLGDEYLHRHVFKRPRGIIPVDDDERYLEI